MTKQSAFTADRNKIERSFMVLEPIVISGFKTRFSLLKTAIASGGVVGGIRPREKRDNSNRFFFLTSLLILFFASAAFADTFVHHKTNEKLHGYVTSQKTGSRTFVQTAEKGMVQLELARWKVTPDRTGRNKQVIIITLDKEIILDIETTALEEAFREAADKGPVCILFEIDTPGGREDFARRLCSAVTATKNCEVIAFVKGGEFGGALSVGAALALSCDQIYMADNTVIGAATLVNVSEKGVQDLKESHGEDIGEKISSAWQAYLASLAQQNDRPGLLAKAMVDKEIEVIEVTKGDKRLFIDPVNKRQDQQLVHTWSKKGSLLTLTAEEAVKCGIADKMTGTREELLSDKGIGTAELIFDEHLLKARKEFQIAAKRQYNLRKSIDLQTKDLMQTEQLQKALKLFRGISADFKSLITLAKKYPDFGMSVQALEAELNTIESIYKNLKINARRRK